MQNSAVECLNSYLSQRTLQVEFRNITSKIIKMQSDAPQACLLGPILFTLFNYDFPSVALHSKVLIYAGDVKIFNAFNNVS